MRSLPRLAKVGKEEEPDGALGLLSRAQAPGTVVAERGRGADEAQIGENRDGHGG